MRFREFKITELTNPVGSPNLFRVTSPRSQRGPEIRDIQLTLIALGYPLPKFGADGIIGRETKSAILKYQQDHNLNPNGRVDTPTADSMNANIDDLRKDPEENAQVLGMLVRSTPADVKLPKKFKSPSSSSADVSKIQDPDFNMKLEKVSKELGVKSKDLIAIFQQESGMNPQAVNPVSGATGLIQFMPSTAQGLGTSTEELKKMTAAEQLDYVYKYFKSTGVGDGTLGDLYMAVFMPAHIGKPDHFVLGSAGDSGFSGKVYAQNKGLDRDKNGKITVGDVKKAVQRYA